MFFLHEKGFLFAQTLIVFPLVKSKILGKFRFGLLNIASSCIHTAQHKRLYERLS